MDTAECIILELILSISCICTYIHTCKHAKRLGPMPMWSSGTGMQNAPFQQKHTIMQSILTSLRVCESTYLNITEYSEIILVYYFLHCRILTYGLLCLFPCFVQRHDSARRRGGHYLGWQSGVGEWRDQGAARMGKVRTSSMDSVIASLSVLTAKYYLFSILSTYVLLFHPSSFFPLSSSV